jgi:hypothetical protein
VNCTGLIKGTDNFVTCYVGPVLQIRTALGVKSYNECLQLSVSVHIIIVARMKMRGALLPHPHSSSKQDVSLRNETVLPLLLLLFICSAARSVKYK